MEIVFLTGSSGSGKSEKLYKSLIDISEAEPDRRLFLIVPEQFTMQTQKNIVGLSPGHGTFNIDIVSFNRLAYRVFEELSVTLPTAVDDTGKNLILRKIIDERKRGLKIIRPKESQGFVSEIKSVISEMLQYSVTPDMLLQICGRIGENGINGNERLKRKLEDIALIYQGFREYIDGKYITTEEITEILCRYVGKSAILNGSIMAFDGFTGFTPVQYRLIELLFDKVRAMYFTVTMPDKADEQLFDMSIDMMRRLGERADKNCIMTRRVSMGDGIPYRFAYSPSLAHLERNIFRDEAAYGDVAGNITIYSALGAKAEVMYVASRIKRYVSCGGRYKDIGVIVGNMDDYREQIAGIFAEDGIPVFLDNKRPIMANPAVEYLRAAIGVIEKDYSYDSMFRLLRAYMCPVDIRKVDILENYILALGIRGHKKWNTKFSRQYAPKREVNLFEINEVRRQTVELLEPLREVFCNKDSTVRDYIMALDKFLDGSMVYEKLEELKKQAEKDGMASSAKEYGQVYANIIKLFEQTAGLLGDEKMGIRQFADILDAGFNEIKLGIIPPTSDMVMVGDVERTRLDHVHILFFIGVNEGVIPRSNSSQGLFSEAERETLAMADLELSPTCRQKTYMQNFYLYLLLTKPSESLVFTYDRRSKPSKLIASLLRMFPKAYVCSDDTVCGTELVGSRRGGMQYLFERLGDKEALTDKENALLAVMWGETESAYRMREIAYKTVRDVTDERITREAVRMLYGDIIRGSVSRMETYASCPFEYFAMYGLELEERQLYEIGAADLGTLYHNGLKIYSERLAENKLNFGSADDTTREKYVREALDIVMADYGNSVFYDSRRNEYMRTRIYNMLIKTAWALGEQTKAGSFEPASFEKNFVFEKDGMLINGKIDRIDYADNDGKSYVKIIDYKSGRKSFDLGRLYDGLQLQLMIYLESLMNEHIPAAALYYNIDDPIVDYKDGMDDGEIKTELLTKLRPNGLINGDKEAVRLLDKVTVEGKSSYIPVFYNKDGDIKAGAQVTTQDRLRVLGEYAVCKMTEIGQDINDGKVAPKPYKDSCEYCRYRLLCHFYDNADELKFRNHTKLKADEEGYKLFEKRVRADNAKLD